MYINFSAIVLHAVKYGDSQLIVDLLSRERGRTTVVARVSQRGRTGLRRQYFQPLTLLSLVAEEKAPGRLPLVREARMARPLAGLSSDPRKLAVALFLAEFLDAATRGEQQGEALFDYTEASLAWLDAAEGGFSSFHLVYMMHLTRFIGFFPNLEDAREGDWFDLRGACFTPAEPLHADCVAPHEAVFIRQLMRLNFETMHLFRMSRQQRNRATDIALWYYRLHVAGFPEMKSLEVVRTLF